MTLQELKLIAEAATSGRGQSQYTHPRDDNNWKANELFVRNFDKPTALALIAVAEAAQAAYDFESGNGFIARLNPLREALANLKNGLTP